MKRVCKLLIMIVSVLILFSCNYSDRYLHEIDEMFKSFEYNDNYVLLTHFELVIKEERYKRKEIKYNGKLSNILFLEQDGFYSYTYDEESFFVEFLFTTYENFEVNKIGSLSLPSKLLSCTWGNYSYWLRIDDPLVEEYSPIYYCWNINSKKMTIEEKSHIDEEYKYDADNFRNNNFLFESKSNIFSSTLDIIDKKSNVKKTINKSILNKFEEGQKIKSHTSSTSFNPGKVYVDDRDFYITLSFGADFLAEHYYYYIIKWNFDTEEASYYTSIYFDYFQEWNDDFIILNVF